MVLDHRVLLELSRLILNFGNTMTFNKIFLGVFMTILTCSLAGQDSLKVVQFSGIVLNEKGLVPLYTNVAVKGTSRGTVVELDGFFSLPVREKEVIQFSRIGYELLEVTIPENIEGNLYSQNLTLIKDTLFLPTATIRPWPDRDFFEIEFLALEVENYLEDIAQQNLSPEKLQILRQVLPVDGSEVSKIELQQTAQAYYAAGQFKPQNIFNPLSWKKFIEAIRRGDFKKKDK